MDKTELDFQTAAELSVRAFGPENRALIGVEVRISERQPDGTIRVRIGRWGWDEGKTDRLTPEQYVARARARMLTEGEDPDREVFAQDADR